MTYILKEIHFREKVIKIFLFAMLFSPLISYFVLNVTSGDRSSTYYFSIYSVLLGLLFIAFANKIIEFPKEINFLLIYIIYQIIWMGYSGDISRRGFINVLINNRHIGIFFIFIIIYNTKFSERFIQYSIIVSKITIILASFASIIQVFDNSFLDANPLWQKSGLSDIVGNIYQDRRSSLFAFVDMNELGLSYLPLASATIGYLIVNKSRFIPLFVFAVGITSLLSNGRYVIVGYIILITQYFVYAKFNFLKIFNKIFFILFSLFILYFTLSLVGYNVEAWFAERLFREGSITQTTRYGALENFLIFFPQAIFFGVGEYYTPEIKRAIEFVGSSQIHVGYLSHLISYGLVGSFFLFGFWFLLAKRLYKNAKKTNYWGAFFGFLIFLWAQATLVYYYIFFYGIIFALIFDKYYVDKHSTRISTSRDTESIK